MEAGWLYNSHSPVQDENAAPLLQNFLGISRWQPQNTEQQARDSVLLHGSFTWETGPE